MLPRVVQVVLGIIGLLAFVQVIYELIVIRVHKVAAMRGEGEWEDRMDALLFQWPTIWRALLVACVCLAGIGIIEAIAIHGKRLETCLKRDEE